MKLHDSESNIYNKLIRDMDYVILMSNMLHILFNNWPVLIYQLNQIIDSSSFLVDDIFLIQLAKIVF